MGILQRLDSLTGNGDAATADSFTPALDKNEGNSFSQGLRQGTAEAGGQMRALLGRGAETLGANEFAKEQYAKAGAAQTEAEGLAPEVSDWHQINGLRTGGQYIAGQAGRMMPVLGAGIAGATALGLAAPAVAGTAIAGASLATLPFTTGAEVQRQQSNPETARGSLYDRNVAAGGVGAFDAVASNVIPQIMGGKLIGRGLKAGGGTAIEQAVARRAAAGQNIVGRNLGEAVVGNAAAGVASEGVHQQADTYFDPNRDTSGDNANLINAGLAGAIIGAPFGLAGMAGDKFHGSRPMRTNTPVDAAPAGTPPASGPSYTERAKRFMGLDVTDADRSSSKEPVSLSAEAAKARGGVEGDSIDNLFETSAKGGAIDLSAARAAARGEEPALAKGVEPTEAAFKEVDDTSAQELFKAAYRMSKDVDITPEQQQFLGDFEQQGNAALKDPAYRKQLGEMLTQHDNSKTSLDDANAALNELKNSDSDPARYSLEGKQRLAEALRGQDGKIRWPYNTIVGFDTHTESAQMAIVEATSRAVRLAGTKGEMPAAIEKYLQKLTDGKAASLIARLGDEQFPDGAGSERLYKVVNRLTASAKTDKTLTDVVTGALPDDVRKRFVDDGRMPELVARIKGLLNDPDSAGSTEKGKEAKARLTAKLQETFGVKYESVMEAFGTHAEETQKNIGLTPPDRTDVTRAVNDTIKQEEGFDQNPVDRQPAYNKDGDEIAYTDSPVYYGAKVDGDKHTLIMDDEAHSAAHPQDTETARTRQMARAEADYPGRAVNWMPAKEYALMHGISKDKLGEMTGGRPEDFGTVVVEGTNDETKVGPSDIEQMRVGKYEKKMVDGKMTDVRKEGRVKTSIQNAATSFTIQTQKGKVAFDASRVASYMQRAEGKNLARSEADDAGGSLHRSARGFVEGLAALSQHYGVRVEPEDSVVVVNQGGRQYTYGELKQILKNGDSAVKAADKADSVRESRTDLMERRTDLLEQQKEMLDDQRKGGKVDLSEIADIAQSLREIDAGIKKTRGRTDASDDAINPLRETRDRLLDERDQLGRDKAPATQIAAKTAEVKKAIAAVASKRVELGLNSNTEKLYSQRERLIKKMGETTYPDILEGMEVDLKRLDDKIDNANLYEYRDNDSISDLTRYKESQGMSEIAPESQIHLAAAEHGDSVKRQVDFAGDALPRPKNPKTKFNEATYNVDEDGVRTQGKTGDFRGTDTLTPDTISRVRSLFDSMAQRAIKPSQKLLTEKGLALMDNLGALTPNDQRSLATLNGKNFPQTASVIRNLASRYESLMPTLDAQGNIVKSTKLNSKITEAQRVEAFVARVADPKNEKGMIQSIGKTKSESINELVDNVRVLTQKKHLPEHVARVVDAANNRIRQLIAEEGPGDGTLRYDMMIDKRAQREVTGREAFDDAAFENEMRQMDQEGKPSSQALGTGVTSAKLKGDIAAHIDKVLKDSVELHFRNNSLYSGLFDKAGFNNSGKPLIEVSVRSLDPMSVAHHESMHAFMGHIMEHGLPEVRAVLQKAADSAVVLGRLRVLLKDDPDSIKQLMGDREERIAYMYQFSKTLGVDGKPMLQLGGSTRGVFQKIGDAIKGMLGIWTNDARAQHIMEYFHSGEYAKSMTDKNAVQRAMMGDGNNRIVDRVGQGEIVKSLGKLGSAMVGIGGQRLRDTGIPAISKVADLVRSRSIDASEDVGYITASGTERRKRMNQLITDMKGLDGKEISEENVKAAFAHMQEGTVPTDKDQRIAQMSIRKMLDGTFDYMVKADVAVRDMGAGRDYLPVMWDMTKLASNQTEALAMLEKYRNHPQMPGTPEQVLANLIRNEGSEYDAALNMNDKPGMQFIKRRVLHFIKPEDKVQFLENDPYRVLNSYMTQATKRAEWARRFGDGNEKLDKMREQAVTEGASAEQIEVMNKYISGVNGTLGSDVSANWRKLSSNMMVYQNIRLLPLGVFSAAIDPVGIILNGGTVRDAGRAFIQGIKDVPRGFKHMPESDARYKMAEDMGTIENAVLQHRLGASFGGTSSAGSFARTANETFFKYNLMEQFNTSMRVAATEASMHFLTRHADGKADQHSMRRLNELGLTPADIKVANGRPAVRASEFEALGYSPERAQAASDKMVLAVNKWVDGAVLRPDASQKAIWMSDPHYAIIAHMKQFSFAFHETILKRVAHETAHGNYSALAGLAGYIPVMLAADITKGLIQGGGSQPDWREGWDIGDYISSATQRAGLFGVGQFGIDVAKDIRQQGTGLGAMFGPTIGQLTDIASLAGGHKEFSGVAISSMPANSLWKNMFSGGGKGGAEAPLEPISD